MNWGLVAVLCGLPLLISMGTPARSMQEISGVFFGESSPAGADRQSRPVDSKRQLSAGAAGSSISVKVTVTSQTTPMPDRFCLFQNYPNPFNSATKIRYDVPITCRVNLDIYNILGRKVRTLVDKWMDAGSYSVTWDGKTESGQTAASGVYLYHIRAGRFISTKKMILMK
jgi:flagellar hook assembly protein FlgD